MRVSQSRMRNCSYIRTAEVVFAHMHTGITDAHTHINIQNVKNTVCELQLEKRSLRSDHWCRKRFVFILYTI